jgi:hypothetical protein
MRQVVLVSAALFCGLAASEHITDALEIFPEQPEPLVSISVAQNTPFPCERALGATFSENGYLPLDHIRRMMWDGGNVDWCYPQNILLFVQGRALREYPQLEASMLRSLRKHALVHPRSYKRAGGRLMSSLGMRSRPRFALKSLINRS